MRELHVIGGSAAHVHQDHRALARRHQWRHRGVGVERAHVVDDRRAHIQRDARDGRLARVDRDRHAEPSLQPFQHRRDAFDFDLGRDLPCSARTGRFAANIYNRGASGFHLERVRGRTTGIYVSPAVGE